MKLSPRYPIYLVLILATVKANEDPSAPCEHNCKKIDGPFMDPSLTQPCEYSCPDMSESTVGIYCPRNFDDCKCDAGTERDGDVCTCVSAFECPSNSNPRSGCPVSIRQCVCQSGFELVGDECVCVERECMPELPECDFECPSKSSSAGLECPTSFDDCACESGYAAENDACVCDSVCPENSVQKPDNPCPKIPCRHCDCVEGYAMIEGECIKECDYLCPPNSKPKDGLGCAQDFSDCECAPGLEEVNGESCVSGPDGFPEFTTTEQPGGPPGSTTTEGPSTTVWSTSVEPTTTQMTYQCETAWAFAPSNDQCVTDEDTSCSFCFVGLEGVRGEAWGWSVGRYDFTANFSVKLEFWAGAGQCVREGRGTDSAVVTVTNDVQSGLSIDIVGKEDWFFNAFHLYVGEDYLPNNGRRYSAAPGMLGHVFDDLNNVPAFGITLSPADLPNGFGRIALHGNACTTSGPQEGSTS